MVVRHKTIEVLDQTIFYREAGDSSRPALVLLHGFPTSSHMYRELLHGLAEDFYIVAPDYPGFGNSSFPSPDEFEYTFDNLGVVMNAFLETKGIERYTLMIQDYGAPVGFRIAIAYPERIDGIIAMNGNAYEQGLGTAGWGVVFDYWKNKTPEIEQQIIESVFSHEGMRWQYTHGTRNPDGISPDNWDLDFFKISRPGQHRIQLDLFYDYQNNVKAYPKWQAYLREYQPPMLIVWGKNDAFFPQEGAEAYLKDVPNAELHLLDTGHFALEEEAPFITEQMREFLQQLHP